MACKNRTSRVVPWIVALAMLGTTSPSRAQSPEELAAARSLFSEALRDQDQKRFDVALEKFRRVQDVRDTSPIRYRIGMCHEGLGHLAQALAAYQATIEMGAKDRAHDEVVKAARGRVDALSRRVPHLSLSLSGRLPSEVDVRVDDRRIPSESLKEPLPVDPGEHVITASAASSKPFRTVVFLSEGGTAALMIPLDAEAVGPTTAAPPLKTADAPDAAPPTSRPPDKPNEAAASRVAGSTQRAVGVVVFGSGAVLGIVGTVFYFMRRSEIGKIHDACPGDICPLARRPEIEASRDRAVLYGPLSAGLGLAGVAALGIGGYLFLSAPTRDASPTVSVVPRITGDAAGVVMTGAF